MNFLLSVTILLEILWPGGFWKVIQSSNTINGKFLKSCQAVVQNYTRELDSPEYVENDYVEEGYFEEQLV